MRFLPAGRVQNAMGALRATTAYNRFVSGTVHDNMNSIMERASEAAELCAGVVNWLRLQLYDPETALFP